MEDNQTPPSAVCPDYRDATPARLRDGSWGAWVAGTVTAGQSVTITTKSGKSWVATVTRVIWRGDGITLVATGGLSRDRVPRGSRCPDCGSGECNKTPGSPCEPD
jgi:hypothetical protein